jgi:hypothetical protein
VSWAVSPCSEPPEDIGDSVFHAEAPVAGSMRNPRTRRHGTGEDQPPRIRVNATDGAPTGWCLVSPSSMCARSPQHRLVRHQSGVDRAWFRDARPARTGGAEAAMGFQRVTRKRNVLLASTRPGAMHRWPAGSVIPAESASTVRRIRTAGTALSGTGGSRTRCPAEVQLRCRPVTSSQGRGHASGTTSPVPPPDAPRPAGSATVPAALVGCAAHVIVALYLGVERGERHDELAERRSPAR